MSTQTFNNDYSDIAIDTVARYAGVSVLDVLSALGQRFGRRQPQTFSVPAAFQVRHRRALQTVAKYGGIDIETVRQRLVQIEQPVLQDEFRHTDKAA